MKEENNSSESQQETQDDALRCIILPTSITNIILISIRQYFRNFIPLVTITIIYTLPFAAIFYIFHQPSETVQDDNLNIFFYGILESFRQHFMEASIMLLLPSLIFGHIQNLKEFLSFFFSKFAGRIVFLSLILLSANYLLMHLFSFLGTMLFTYFMLLVFPVMIICSNEKSNFGVIKRNFKLIMSNPAQSLAMFAIPNAIYLLVQLPILLLSLSIWAGDPDVLSQLGSDDSKNMTPEMAMSYFLNATSYTSSNLFRFLNVLAIVFIPLKGIIFCNLVMSFMTSHDKESLNSFLKRYGMIAGDKVN